MRRHFGEKARPFEEEKQASNGCQLNGRLELAASQTLPLAAKAKRDDDEKIKIISGLLGLNLGSKGGEKR